LQAPPDGFAASSIAFDVSLALMLLSHGRPSEVGHVGSMPIQAPVFAPTADSSLLDVKLTVDPHPSDVLPPKKQLLRPMGNMQVWGGRLAGGLDVAIAAAEMGSVWMPSTRRNVVWTCDAN
jgi:hypothetical protein